MHIADWIIIVITVSITVVNTFLFIKCRKFKND